MGNYPWMNLRSSTASHQQPQPHSAAPRWSAPRKCLHEHSSASAVALSLGEGLFFFFMSSEISSFFSLFISFPLSYPCPPNIPLLSSPPTLPPSPIYPGLLPWWDPVTLANHSPRCHWPGPGSLSCRISFFQTLLNSYTVSFHWALWAWSARPCHLSQRQGANGNRVSN